MGLAAFGQPGLADVVAPEVKGDSEDFWIDAQIRVVSPRGPGWCVDFAEGLSGVGVAVDLARVRDADG